MQQKRKDFIHISDLEDPIAIGKSKIIKTLLVDSFLKVATTQVDFIFIELMLHPSHEKQMYNQQIHLTH